MLDRIVSAGDVGVWIQGKVVTKKKKREKKI